MGLGIVALAAWFGHAIEKMKIWHFPMIGLIAVIATLIGNASREKALERLGENPSILWTPRVFAANAGGLFLVASIAYAVGFAVGKYRRRNASIDKDEKGSEE